MPSRKVYRYRLHLGGDTVGRMCGTLGPPCDQCGDVSDVLCDGRVGRKLCAPEMGDNKNYCSEHTANAHPLVPILTPQEEWDRLTKAAGMMPPQGMSQLSAVCGHPPGVVINLDAEGDEP